MYVVTVFGSSVSTEFTASAQKIDRLYQNRVYFDRVYGQYV